MDYVNVVVHIFQREARDFYRIENLWADAIRTDHDGDGAEVVFADPSGAVKQPSKPVAKTKAVAKNPAKSTARKTTTAKKTPKKA